MESNNLCNSNGRKGFLHPIWCFTLQGCERINVIQKALGGKLLAINSPCCWLMPREALRVNNPNLVKLTNAVWTRWLLMTNSIFGEKSQRWSLCAEEAPQPPQERESSDSVPIGKCFNITNVIQKNQQLIKISTLSANFLTTSSIGSPAPPGSAKHTKSHSKLTFQKSSREDRWHQFRVALGYLSYYKNMQLLTPSEYRYPEVSWIALQSLTPNVSSWTERQLNPKEGIGSQIRFRN